MRLLRASVTLCLLVAATCLLPAASDAKTKHKVPNTAITTLSAYNDPPDADRSRVYGVAASFSFRVPDDVPLSGVCKGKVKFKLTRGKKTVKKVSATLRKRTFDHFCDATKGFVLPMELKGAKVKVRTEFEGNSYYKPYTDSVTLELPNY